jgi:hypothetical protein
MARNVFDKFRSSLYLILPLLLLICLASCCPVFQNPIPPPSELKADHQILGTWVRTFKGGQHESKEQLSIFQRSSGWIDVVYIYDIESEVSADGINLLVFEGYSTSVNKQQFLCLRFRKKDFNWRLQEKDCSLSDKEIVGAPFAEYWIIVNYEISSNDELIIKRFSTLQVEELIKKGKLKGEIVKEDVSKRTLFENATFKGQRFEDILKADGLSPNQVIVTSSSDELIEAISREGVEAFIWQDANDVLRDIYILVFSRIKP